LTGDQPAPAETEDVPGKPAEPENDLAAWSSAGGQNAVALPQREETEGVCARPQYGVTPEGKR